MEPVIVDANDRVSSEVIDQESLLKLCYTMLNEANKRKELSEYE
jgi:hypothetical protein